ncbi:MAG: DNA topoisomerase IB [Actinomycetota bacterium]
MPRTRRSDPTAPGITRRRRGRGFEYLGPDGATIRDDRTLHRIRSLAVPPAWADVWICADPRGHLQATGVDNAGRRQYRYHDDWRTRRDAEKFDRMLRFAESLPDLRTTVTTHLRRTRPDRERVLACAVRMLDRGLFRIGSEVYAAQNETFGLATIRRDHVQVRGTSVSFDYTAKGGLRRTQSIEDPPTARVLASLKRRRGGGEELLAYRDARTWIDVRSEDINAYLKDHACPDCTAKDFRTWHATVLGAVAVASDATGAHSPSARKRVVSAAVKTVATSLGNTPTVARDSYIDPRVFDRFRSGWTIAPSLELPGDALPGAALQLELERAVIDLLEEPRTSEGVERVTGERAEAA